MFTDGEGVRLVLKIVTGDVDRDDLTSMLDELVTEGARRMLLTALEAEVADYIDRHQKLVDAGSGHRLVVRTGEPRSGPW